jgi:hypothetical protein
MYTGDPQGVNGVIRVRHSDHSRPFRQESEPKRRNSAGCRRWLSRAFRLHFVSPGSKLKPEL